MKLALCMLGELHTQQLLRMEHAAPAESGAWLGDGDSHRHRMQTGRGQGLLCPPACLSSLALLLVASPQPPAEHRIGRRVGMEPPVGALLPPCGSSVRGAGRRAACEVQAISVLEPEAGVPSRALLCSLPPYHFTFTQQVLTYLVPAGGLALGWALGVFLQDTHDCHFPVGYFLDGG